MKRTELNSQSATRNFGKRQTSLVSDHNKMEVILI